MTRYEVLTPHPRGGIRAAWFPTEAEARDHARTLRLPFVIVRARLFAGIGVGEVIDGRTPEERDGAKR